MADLTDRIQVFDRDGKFLRGWQTPDFNVDGPSGLTIDRHGRLLVADTHFYRVLVYSPDGKILLQIGDGVQGTTPGRFGYPTRRGDRQGGQLLRQRVRRERPDPGLLARGEVAPPVGRARLRARPVPPAAGHGDRRPGPDLRRRQRDQPDPGLRHPGQAPATLGRPGATGPGEMAYPFDVAIGPDESVYVCEYGNHRVQKFTLDGKPLGVWGESGRGPGQLYNPWALAVDSRGAVSVDRLEQPPRPAVPAVTRAEDRRGGRRCGPAGEPDSIA